MSCESRIRLYVVSHKEVWIPKAECLIPIRADRTDGINIANKTNYCELRAQYWVWKNIQCNPEDYIGFFHYRRYLDLEYPNIITHFSEKRPIPYQIQKQPDPKVYSNLTLKLALEDLDVIAPVWEYTGLPIWRRYKISRGHRISDLELVYQIIMEKYPEFMGVTRQYLDSKGEYYGNIFIMKRCYFEAYCQWLFDILDEFDNRVSEILPFTDGYLGERLFGIYFTWLTQQIGRKCGEIPRIHYSLYDDKTHRYSFRKIGNKIFPPGSLRKGILLKLKNHISLFQGRAAREEENYALEQRNISKRGRGNI